MKTLDDDGILVALTESPIDVQSGYAYVNHPECGGIASFVGTTRNYHGNRKVRELKYEAYDGMALSEMRRICKRAKELSNDSLYRLWVVHRIGVVPVQESSIAIFASSPHRREALDAVNFIIDEVKASVPIWKKEFYEGFVEPAVWKSCPRCLEVVHSNAEFTHSHSKPEDSQITPECNQPPTAHGVNLRDPEWKTNTEWRRPDLE